MAAVSEDKKNHTVHWTRTIHTVLYQVLYLWFLFGISLNHARVSQYVHT